MEALLKGAFSINRPGNAFAGVAIDMASEQSINAHTENALKGIMTYADIDSAVNRWHVTSPMRSEISNLLLNMLILKVMREAIRKSRNKERKETKKIWRN